MRPSVFNENISAEHILLPSELACLNRFHFGDLFLCLSTILSIPGEVGLGEISSHTPAGD